MTTTRVPIWARAFALIGWSATLLAAVAAIVLRIVDPAPVLPGPFGFGDLALVGFAVMGLTFASVGALLVIRRHRNAVGWLMVIVGLSYGTSDLTAAVTFSAAALETTAGDRLAGVAGSLTVLMTTIGGLIWLLPFIFPTGRGHGPTSDRIIRFLIPLFAVTPVIFAIQPGPLHVFSTIENPFGVGPDLRPVLGVQLSVVVAGGAALFAPVVIAWVIWRFRSAGDIERQQLKWFALASAVSITGVSLAAVSGALSDESVGEAGLAVFGWAGSLIPIAIGIAILRHRLYDIDRLISRTIAYGIVTSILAVVSFGALTLLSAILSQFAQGAGVAVALTTLAAFAAFQPIVRRVRTNVDRRFDRARYDAERTVIAFASRLRHEVDIETVTRDLASTAHVAVAPATLGMWVRPRHIRQP